MTIQDIINIYNTALFKNSSVQLILHKFKDTKPIKAIKYYVWNIWYCYARNKKLLFTIEQDFKETTDEELKKNNETMEALLLYSLIQVSRNNDLINSLIDGSYNSDKLVLDTSNIGVT